MKNTKRHQKQHKTPEKSFFNRKKYSYYLIMGKTSKSKTAKRNVKSKRNMKSKRHRMTSKKNSRKSVTRRRRMKGGNRIANKIIGGTFEASLREGVDRMSRKLENSRVLKAAQGMKQRMANGKIGSIKRTVQGASKMVNDQLEKAENTAKHAMQTLTGRLGKTTKNK